jgi:hypothetical protein
VNIRVLIASFALLAAAPLAAQGPGSCGFHLDVDADLTSTHAAVADMPGAPGSGLFGYPPGVPGNPYAAHVTPGTEFKLKLSVPPSLLGAAGAAPIGPGSVITVFWAIGTPNIPAAPNPGMIPPCQPGQPYILSVIPWNGVLVDGNGWIVPPAPLTPLADPGWPHNFELVLTYPLTLPLPPVVFQAALLTPVGLIAISNGVSILAGPNPAEVNLIPGLVPVPGFPPLDEGFALGLPSPPGFLFYGFPAPVFHASTNGFLDFRQLPFMLPADFSGQPGDLGCAPPTATASPRLAANHFDIDLSIPSPAPRAPGLTMELAPLGPAWPSRTIVRWKNVVDFGLPGAPPDTNYATFVAELWGMDGPGGLSRLVVVRQEMHSVFALANHDLVGIGPGVAGQGFGGPPPMCLNTPLWPLWGGLGAGTPPAGGIYMDTVPNPPGLLDSHLLSNLAVAFDPSFMVIPDFYTVTVY